MLSSYISRSALLALALLAACGGSGMTNPPPAPPPPGPPPPPPPPPPGPVPAANVQVRNDVFVPENVIVTVGGTVTWQWVGTGHSVTSVLSPTFPSSAIETAPFTHGPITFSTPGTYNYICSVHGSVSGGQTAGMRGTVIVQ